MTEETKYFDDDIKKFVCKHTSVRLDSLNMNSRLGEDLSIVGDDARELIEDFEITFKVDVRDFPFQEYFPDEATADMHFYLATKIKRNRNMIYIIYNKFMASVYKYFSSDKQYKTLRLNDMLAWANNGKWDDSITD